MGVLQIVSPNRLDDAGIDLLLDELRGNTDRVLDSQGGTGTVGNDADAVDSQQGTAAVVLIVGLPTDGTEGVPGNPSAKHPEGGLSEFMLEPTEDGAGGRLGGLQDDIAGESVAENHLNGMLEEVMSFDIPSEIQGGGFQELENVLCEFTSFDILTADRHQADLGIAVAEDMLRKDRAHDRVLKKMDRAGVDIRTGIDKDADVLLGGKVRGDAGTLDALKSAELDRRSRDGGTCMTGADDGIGLTLLDEIDSTSNGGVFLATDGIDGRIAHLHNLGGVNDLDPGIVATEFSQLGLDGRIVPGEEEFGDLRVFPESHSCSGNRTLRGVVTPHGIEGNPHDPASTGPIVVTGAV